MSIFIISALNSVNTVNYVYFISFGNILVSILFVTILLFCQCLTLTFPLCIAILHSILLKTRCRRMKTIWKKLLY